MANWFKKKRRKIKAGELSSVPLNKIDYPPKIILAWSQAVLGNDEIMLWLKDNGYEELCMATYAIYLKDEARNWLQAHGYAHLLAMINAAEGNESAQRWLLVHDFEVLYHIAMAVEEESLSIRWLAQNAPKDVFILTKAIKKIKDQIEENHNDVHTFRQDF
ncbi:MAG: NADH:ubiquinone oxidoreductase subunit C [Crocinitomicaceae bacterium]|jgi:NADH:ubiquinone oxidoreductase subunit C